MSMKYLISIVVTVLMFWGCSKGPKVVSDEEACAVSEMFPMTHLHKSEFKDLPNWHDEDYVSALDSFINSCRTAKTQKIYEELCQEANNTKNAKEFLQTNFEPYQINTEHGEEEGLLTGYYEPQLSGSIIKKGPYVYPIYKTPSDLIEVDLSEIYPDLKHYRLRGRLEDNKLVPYYERSEFNPDYNEEDIICYTDSKIDLFFLEIQGSGRVALDNGETIFIGYDNQNGHRYRAIGKYLVSIGALKMEEVSLQSIRAWLENNPKRVDEVLNYNKSVVYFRQRESAASGSLGLELTPKRSVAVDRRFIPLGTMLYLDTKIKDDEFSSVVVAQDTGGAIKGAIRADIFLGHGDEAMNVAGELKAPLQLWVLLPKNKKEDEI